VLLIAIFLSVLAVVFDSVQRIGATGLFDVAQDRIAPPSRLRHYGGQASSTLRSKCGEFRPPGPPTIHRFFHWTKRKARSIRIRPAEGSAGGSTQGSHPRPCGGRRGREDGPLPSGAQATLIGTAPRPTARIVYDGRMRVWIGIAVMAWLLIACGEDAPRETPAPEAEPREQSDAPPATPPESPPVPLRIPMEAPLPRGEASGLAPLAPADCTAYVEIAPPARWNVAFDWLTEWIPRAAPLGAFPRSLFPPDIVDIEHALAFAYRGTGVPRRIFRIGDPDALKSVEAGNVVVVRNGDFAALTEETDTLLPATPTAIAADLPSGLLRGRVRVGETFRRAEEDGGEELLNMLRRVGLPNAGAVIDALRATREVTVAVDGDEDQVAVRADVLLTAPAFQDPSQLPALLAALPEDDYAIVIAVDAGFGLEDHESVASFRGIGAQQVSWVEPLLASAHLNGGHVLAMRPDPDGSSLVQIVRGGDFDAYFREIENHVRAVAGRTPYLQATETTTGSIAGAPSHELRIVPDLEGGLPTRGPEHRRHDLAFRYGKGKARPDLLEAIAQRIDDRLLRIGRAAGSTYVRDGLIVVERDSHIDDSEKIRHFVEKPFGFELHRLVTPSDPGYDFYVDQLDRAGETPKHGMFIPAEQRRPEDVKANRYPAGLRWYPVYERQMAKLLGPPGSSRRVLCSMDAENICSADVADAWHERISGTDRYRIHVRFRKEAAQRLTRLMGGDPLPALAVILNQEVELAARMKASSKLIVRIPGRHIREDAADIAHSIRLRPLRHELRFEKTVPARRFMGELDVQFEQLRSILPDRVLRIRGVKLGSYGILGINLADAHWRRAIEQLRETGGRIGPSLRAMIEAGSGEPRVLARFDAEPLLTVIDDVVMRENFRFGLREPSAVPAVPGNRIPTLRMLASGGTERVRVDITIGTSLGRRLAARTQVVRTHGIARDLFWRYSQAARKSPGATPSLSDVAPEGSHQDPWGNPYELQFHSDGSAVVRSNGPDGKRLTEDDIVEPRRRWAVEPPPTLSLREWVERYVDALKNGTAAQLPALRMSRLSGRDQTVERWLGQQLMDARKHRRLRIAMRREPHEFMDTAAVWQHLAGLDEKLFAAGKFSVEFVDAAPDDRATRIRVRYRRDGREGVATALIEARNREWVLLERFDWYGD